MGLVVQRNIVVGTAQWFGENRPVKPRLVTKREAMAAMLASAACAISRVDVLAKPFSENSCKAQFSSLLRASMPSLRWALPAGLGSVIKVLMHLI